MNTQNMYNFFFIHGSKLSVPLLALLFGEGVSVIDTANKNPAIASIIAGVLAAVIVKYVDKWLEGRNKTIKTGDKILELEHADKKELREKQEKLMAEKEAWYKSQLDRTNAEKFEANTRYRTNLKEAREINHAAINQIMSQQNIILGMQRTMLLKGLEIPEVSILELTKFMLPMWEQELEGEKNDKSE